MDKLLIQYILFTYSPDPRIATTDPCVAAMTLRSSDGQTPRLNVYIRPDWDKNYESGEMVRLASGALNEWETCKPHEAEALFNEMLDASWGPLRMERRGTCTETELKELLAKELQIGISSQ